MAAWLAGWLGRLAGRLIDNIGGAKHLQMSHFDCDKIMRLMKNQSIFKAWILMKMLVENRKSEHRKTD
jgi:hypothetical protein